ncbi:MAG: hypothetical protein IJT77_09695 [Clostridia bacterium]|nr:hypothetical protein [Clostridia bacterium]
MALIEIKKTKYTSLNSKTNTRYIYENTLYFDDVLNKKVTKRKVVGKIDPVSGAEIETGPVGRRKKEIVPPPSIPEEGCRTHDDGNSPTGSNQSSIDLQVLETISSTLLQIVSEIQVLHNCVDQLIHDVATR